MSIFGKFYNRKWRPKARPKTKSKHAAGSQSELWSAALLRGSDERSIEQAGFSKRLLWLFCFVGLLVVAVLLARLAYIQIVFGQQNRALAASNRLRIQTVAAPRGAIYDRQGVLLARNNAQFDVVVVPSHLPQKAVERDKIYGLLASLLKVDPTGLKQRIEQPNQLTPEVVVAEKVDRETALNVEEKHAQLPAVSVETNPARDYLFGSSLPHLLGYIGRISPEELKANPAYRGVDIIGKSGLEQSYEQQLRGRDGKEQVEVDAGGRPLKYLAKVEPEAGNSLVLTIDQALQQKATEALAAGIAKHGAKAGAVVALAPKTGEVLAAVNYPSYDGNLFARGISAADYNALADNPDKPLFDRAFSGNYPIGSTVKPFVSVAGLQENIINASTTVLDAGKLEVPNIYNPSIVYVFKGWKPEGLGVVNITRAIAWSSDIFFYMVGGGHQSFRGLGVAKLTDWYKRFGFGAKTGVDMGGEGTGYVPTPESKKRTSKEPWSTGDTYNISIGQGDFRATPLQLAVATGAIANGGTIYKPSLVSKVQTPDGKTVQTYSPQIVRKDIASPANIELVRRGMEEAVDSGTACCSIKREVSVKVAGKTGTAETSSEGFDGKNPRTKPHAWFSAYAPANDPKVVLIVLVENSAEGAEVSVPIAKDILAWYFQQPR